MSSCVPNKKVVYLNDLAFDTNEELINNNKPEKYNLQAGDVINIRIKTLDTESAAYFNTLSEGGFFNFNPLGMYLNSHSIDREGNIEFPEIGSIQVGGLTISEVQEKITVALEKYLNNATIIVKLVSFKITVLGEVNKPGFFYIYNDQANIFEGIGMAGDLTDLADRENIILIRQISDGTKTTTINLNQSELLNSKYYFLQPNDVIYVQPLNAKIVRGNVNTLNILSVLFAAISSTVLVLNYINPR